MPTTYSGLAELKFCSETPQVFKEFVVRLDLNIFAQVLSDVVIDLARVHKENDLVLGDHGICEENGVEVDIRSTKVKQPGNLVQHVQHHSLVLLILQFFLEPFDLVRVRFTYVPMRNNICRGTEGG